MTSAIKVAVVGYLPPPQTGQALATERLLQGLSGFFDVDAVPQDGGGEARSPVRRLATTGRLLRGGADGVRQRTATADVVVWASISPTTSGHARDLLLARALPLERTIGWSHWGQFAERLSSPIVGRSVATLLSKMARVGFLEPALLPEDHSESMIVLPNMLSDDFPARPDAVSQIRCARSQRLGDGNRTAKLLFLGMLSPSKGLDRVLSATRMLVGRGVRVELQLVGRWESESVRRQFQPIVRAAAWTTLTGPIAAVDVPAIMDDADLLVFPTRYETEAQPLVLIEAMSRGLPVVTTPWRAVPDIVGEDGEALVSDDAAALATGLGSMLDPERNARESERLYERYLNRYAHRVALQRWRTAIEDVAVVA